MLVAMLTTRVALQRRTRRCPLRDRVGGQLVVAVVEVVLDVLQVHSDVGRSARGSFVKDLAAGQTTDVPARPVGVDTTLTGVLDVERVAEDFKGTCSGTTLANESRPLSVK